MNIAELEGLFRQLERRLAAAESEITALKSNLGLRKFVEASPAPAQPAEPEGTRIFYPTERAKIALPKMAEAKRLLEVVLVKYPKLRPYSLGDRFAEDAFFREFCAAFEFITMTGRSDEIDTKRSLSWWASEATEWNRLRKTAIDVGGAALLAAAVASGDVDYVVADAWGNSWSFALATFGGRPATEAWRSVLDGQLRQPLPGVHKPSGERASVRLESNDQFCGVSGLRHAAAPSR